MDSKLLLVSHYSKKSYFVKDISSDFHTDEGILLATDMQSNKDVIISSRKKRFTKFVPTLSDLKPEFSRGPQIILNKDIGYILAKTAVNGNSSCVDAGGGTGALSFSLANVCRKVTCYELNPNHLKVLKKNKEMVGITNLTIKAGDVAKELSETNLDLVTLDLPKPWEALLKIESALKLGGWLVVYLPNMIQMKQTLDALPQCKSLKLIELSEVNTRQWKYTGEILKPEHTQIVHTGFLAFVRKL